MSLKKEAKALSTYISELSAVVAKDVKVKVELVRNVIDLLEQDNTVAFIARYRRERTGNLEADTIRDIKELLTQAKAVEHRKETVEKSIGERITPSIKESLKVAKSLQEVEDIYAPFKPGAKRTLANRARELGLDKAAEMIQEKAFKKPNLEMFVKKDTKGLSSVAEVMAGVQHILADNFAKEKTVSDILREGFEQSNVTLETKLLKGKEDDQKYKEYHHKTISIQTIKSHQVLALNRAEGNKIISVKMNCPSKVSQRFIALARKKCIHHQSSELVRKMMCSALEDCLNRLLLPKLMRQQRAELTKAAEKESVHVFAQNLGRLLLTPPVRNKIVLGMDPGFTHGCKLAVVNSTGTVIDTGVIYPFSERSKMVAENTLVGLLTQHNCSTIALGNGTACRETESFLTGMKDCGKLKKDVVYSIVNEDGASVYSISPGAVNELPNMDVNLRSAVSIARRLQDPLMELIKIDPKHLGVGMYQHDMPDNLLKRSLDGVLEDATSLVGVDVNTASIDALRRIAGLGGKRAEAIIQWRKQHGRFRSRQQLKKVRGIGEKIFEQCAGFVRVMPEPLPETEEAHFDREDSDDSGVKKEGKKRKASESGGRKKMKIEQRLNYNRLDSTVIHPESYLIAESLMALTNARPEDIGQPKMKVEMDNLLKTNDLSQLCGKLNTDQTALNLIIQGLCQSYEHDLRADFAKPLFRCGVRSVDHLTPGCSCTGRISNVTTFGAFVDLGVEFNGLIHKSKMLRQNLDTLGVGDVVEVAVETVSKQNKRIQLRLLRVMNNNVELR